MDAHWGYQDGEVPEYAPCEECGQILRIDRLDLCWEHQASCSGEVDLITGHEESKVHLIVYW